ncbi:MAG TPA: hypothetical protein PKE55_13555 [Kiritimatiellia bacterium]|nr:hypothetical protein [Kiritimatiellia bacterium]
MKKISFQEAVDAMSSQHPEFNPHVYGFMREALDFTIKLLDKPVAGPGRHVTGGELLEGIRKYALQEFGPLAMTVLQTWGIKQCEDFGRVVFIMIEQGVLGKTEDDQLQDFAGGYNFIEAFRKPFLPTRAAPPARSRTAGASVPSRA